MLLLSHFLLSIRADELLNDHEATSDSNYKPSIEHLCKDLSCAKHVKAVAEALNGNWAPSFIDIVTKQLIKHITSLACKELSWLLVLSLLDNLLLQPFDLLLLGIKLSVHLRQIAFSCLNQMVKLVDMLDQNVFFILQVPNIVCVPLIVLIQIVNFLVKIEQLTILILLLGLQVTEFTVLTDLFLQSDGSVIDGLIDTLSYTVNILNLLFQVICHAIILVASLSEA